MEHTNADGRMGPLNRTWMEWLTTLPVFCLLILTLLIGTGEMIHGQLLRMGERMFGDPAAGIQYSYLRADPAKPDCDKDANIDALVQKEMAAPATDDGLGGLFNDAKNPEQIKQSLLAAQSLCQEKYTFYENVSKHVTTPVRAYRTFEEAFFYIFHFGTQYRSLILILMIAFAALSTTLNRHHLTLRPPQSVIDYRVYFAATIIGNAIGMASSIFFLIGQRASGIAMDPVNMVISITWLILFTGLTIISIVQAFNIPKSATPGGSFIMAYLSIPLYAVMAVVAGLVFFLQQYYSGLLIYMGQLSDYSALFLSLTLFIWIGMLLRQTRLIDMLLDIFRPWGLSPEVLTWIIMLFAALGTAYTGASGIFILAAGSIIYYEVANAGARKQYALAATAMSGSLGVVLRPCLLIILITAMNKEVTSDQLYGHGLWVFAMTSTIFLIVSLLVREKGGPKYRLVPAKVAFPASARALVPVAPYVVIMMLVVMFYRYVLDTKLDEYTAAMILPYVMLAIVFFDKIRREPAPAHPVPAPTAGGQIPPAPVERRSAESEAEWGNRRSGKDRRVGFEQAIRTATNETISHIGALLLLMSLSMSLAGVVERTGLMHMLPHHFPNIWVAMTFLVLVKVFIGMVMEPMGAMLLVSTTLAPIAYANGIDPVHFWMMVLTALELGYLLPPVALNQLLTRQVVGEEVMNAADAEVRHKSFYYRYERWLLPVMVISISLIIVAYVPLILYGK
ncbi:TRAP transporter large permease subunit [Aquirhabdus sp.]|uniref:TRAP transporter large permease subunit n=1 Tax=Aquirhabdus sp. TaxID=2824160 RepID=UPI00396CCD9A